MMLILSFPYRVSISSVVANCHCARRAASARRPAWRRGQVCCVHLCPIVTFLAPASARLITPDCLLGFFFNQQTLSL